MFKKCKKNKTKQRETRSPSRRHRGRHEVGKRNEKNEKKTKEERKNKATTKKKGSNGDRLFFFYLRHRFDRLVDPKVKSVPIG